MAYRTVTLKGDPVIVEHVANATITPGYLCEVLSTNKVQKHATAGGQCELLFATEDENQGGSIGDDYSSLDMVRLGIFKSGDEVAAWLTSGDSVAVGDFLESAGDGMLQAQSTDVISYGELQGNRFMAIETVDATTTATRIAVRCL